MISRKQIALFLKILVSAGLLGMLAFWMDWRYAAEIFSEANPAWLVASGMLVTSTIMLDGIRLYLMKPVEGVLINVHIRLALQGAFVSQLGFGIISGDAYRTAGYALRSGAILRPAMHLATARMAGFLATCFTMLFVILMVATLDEPAIAKTDITTAIVSILVTITALLAAIVLLLVLGKKNILPQWTSSVIDAVRAISVRVGLISVAMTIIRGLAFFCVLLAIGLAVPVYVPVLASNTATLAGILPIAFGGLGVKEGALAGVVAFFGISITVAGTAAIMMRMVTVVVSGMLAVLSLIPRKVVKL